jgi:hypothetical protein
VHFECLPNAFFSSGRDDIYDMALASCCDDFIISNSSFGWWCAWLGEKPHSKIIHSGFLHSGRLSKNDPRDYRPERWTAHKKDAYVIDLSDVTFTIPLLFDHQDRKENMELVLYFLQSAFDTNFMICEQGGDIFEYMNQWAEYSQTDSKKFHRTKMLNDMANQAETEIIVNWDCDVIIPPMQVYMAVDELRAGADMVYPYGGGFARMPRNPWFSIVQKSLDIGIVGKEPFKHRGADENSVGGAVMFNRESFLDGGGENENMISFGPEDCERHDRFKLLGYTIRRVGGALYHLNHHTGENSTPRNPFYQDNQAEIEKVRRMTKIELRAYVDSWTWRNQYTNRYYSRISEGAVNSAAIVMEALSFRPASVIDIGCGLGEWNNWHSDYTGLDYRIEEKSLMISRDRYIDCNLEMEFIQLNRKFDLCLCLEVAEHLRPHRAVGLVEMLCGLSDRVLFSAAIPYQGGQGHINERFQSYWAGLFLAHGFGASKEQPDIRYNPGVELWYRQNLILYERGAAGVPQGDDIVEDFVLPEYYLKIAGHLRNRAEGKK